MLSGALQKQRKSEPDVGSLPRKDWGGRGPLPLNIIRRVSYLDVMITEILDKMMVSGSLKTGGSSAAGALTGPRVPNHLVTGHLARGRSAEVWSARHILLGQDVALKILVTNAMDGPYDTRRTFLDEALLARTLSCEHLIQVFDVGMTEAGYPYFSMALATRTLQDCSSAADHLSGLRSTAIALTNLHKRGVVHCDVKATNVLYLEGDNARWVLSDLGLAWNRSRPILVGAGSFGSIAPERFTSAPPTARSDVYSFGRMVESVLARYLDRPSQKRAFQTIVTPLLSDDPDKRPQGLLQVVEELDELLASST